MDSLGDWRRDKYLNEVTEEDYDKELIFMGWVQDVMVLGKISFIILRDRGGTAQVVVSREEVGEETYKTLKKIPRESVIAVKGVVVPNPKVQQGFEILGKSFKILNISKTPLPISVDGKVKANMDTRLDWRFLDLRKPEVQAIFRIRSTVLSAIRDLLLEEGFIEIQTPKIVATATEGGTALFEMKYFDRVAYLNQSPQLFKQSMMATGLDRVFEIGPAFRAEEHDTLRHLNEYTSIDIEMAFADERDAMDILERLIVRAYGRVVAENYSDLEVLGMKISVPELPFMRVEYGKLIEKLQSAGYEIEDEETGKRRLIEWGDDIPLEGMKIIARDYKSLFFITRWPTKLKPFYIMPEEGEEEVSHAFDLNFAEKEL
ncbi:MAG: aspartate--tRNA(Asn) ligase, partial [Thermoplasmata archaeon]|nr:aspartate--tRNA(Asn) ligase [Thermoplasmata archaeon]